MSKNGGKGSTSCLEIRFADCRRSRVTEWDKRNCRGQRPPPRKGELTLSSIKRCLTPVWIRPLAAPQLATAGHLTHRPYEL